MSSRCCECSSKPTAEAMLDGEEAIQEYTNQIDEYRGKGLLPNLNQILPYKVYKIRKQEIGADESIVLSTEDKHFVTVELGFKKKKGKNHVYPRTGPLDASMKSKMNYLGTIKVRGQELIEKAVAVMKRFGKYDRLCNNCQVFFNVYAKEIGLGAQWLTDGDKVTLGVGADTVGIIGAIATVLFALLR